jgi:hypothetical protein
VTANGSPLTPTADRAAFDAADAGWFNEPATHSTWCKVPASTASVTLQLTAP